MKEGTLVWVVASVSEDALQVDCDQYDIVVEPHGYKAMPYYSDKKWTRPLTRDEVIAYEEIEL